MEAYLKILSLFQDLDTTKRRELVAELYQETEQLELQGKHSLNCPHCKNDSISKYGKDKGEQRYKCGGCKKTFKETTGTVLWRIRKKPSFLKFQESMLTEGYWSIREMALKFEISIPIAFAWRQKILLSLPENTKKFEGEVEMDDLWVVYSQKGRKGLKYSKKRGGTKHKGDSNFQVKVLTTTNGSNTEMKVTNIGRISEVDIQRTMGDRFTKNTILISDKHSSISAFAKSNKITHLRFTAKEHVDNQGKGVQLLNNIAGRLNTMLNHTFRGVSTKYLQLYANWFKIKENIKEGTARIDFQDKMLSKKYTWDLYSNIEKVYGKFILNHSVRTYRSPQQDRFKCQNWNQYAASQYAFI